MRYITYPVEDEKVSELQSIGGYLFEKKDVQVYVLANDGKYYLQDPVFKDGILWSCGCGFGDKDTHSGSSLFILLVESKERPHSPIDVMKYPVLDFLRVQRATSTT
jgi:hypothetical protein